MEPENEDANPPRRILPQLPKVVVKAPEVLKAFLEHASKNTPLLFGLLASGLFLSCYARHLYPWQLAHYRWTFIAFTVFMGVYIALLYWFAWRPVRKIRFLLKNMGADERGVLQQYLLENKACAYFDMTVGPVLSLMRKNILIPCNPGAIPLWDAPLMLDLYARIYIHKHPAVVGLTLEQIGSRKPSQKPEFFPPLEEEPE